VPIPVTIYQAFGGMSEMQKEKILIVDDEQINLDFFEVMLSKLGFIVEKAEDGERALQKVKECNPDLIILDNIMPRLSGWEVTKILKNDAEYAEYSTIPVVMFSAMDDVKDKIEGFELGVEDYITKPFNFSEVLARIKAVLRSRDLTKQILHREKRIALTESLNKKPPVLHQPCEKADIRTSRTSSEHRRFRCRRREEIRRLGNSRNRRDPGHHKRLGGEGK
jgi:DNA-binding response OmpR family regulator